MAGDKTSEAQKRASRAYVKRNPEKNRYLKYRTTARTFFRHYAEPEDIIEMFEIFANENPNGGFVKESLDFRNYMMGSGKEKEDWF